MQACNFEAGLIGGIGNVAAEAWNQTEPHDGEAGNASDALEDDNESVVLDGNLSNRNPVSVKFFSVEVARNVCCQHIGGPLRTWQTCRTAAA